MRIINKIQSLLKRNEHSFFHTIPTNEQIQSKMPATSIGRPSWLSIQGFKQTFGRVCPFCSTCTALLCLILLILALIALAFRPIDRVIHVVLVDTGKPLLNTTNRFLSTGLDSSIIADGFKNFNMSNPKLVKLMSPLSPGILRIGGTMADRLWFIPDERGHPFKNSYTKITDGGECSHEEVNCNLSISNFTMFGTQWLNLNHLANKAGLIILFDLNCLIRNRNGSWNSKNAEELIKFSDRHNLSLMWELGNEPNAFKHVFNYEVNATQLAADFKALRKILNSYPRYRNSMIVGPDVTRPLPNNNKSEIYLRTFLKDAGSTIDAVTWHQYYFNGRTATLSDFLNPDVFDLLESQIKIVKDVVRRAGEQTKPIWLGETSSAYGGGAPGYSDRFVASFIWLDKLGVAARNGLSVVVRQSLFKGYYALIDEKLQPTPDWWLSVIYKNLVGPEVVPCYSASSPLVRLYCHCTKTGFSDVIPAITVFGVNMKSIEARVRIEGHTSLEDNKTPKKVLVYVLTSFMSLLSKQVLLNDELLYLQANADLPPIKPKIIELEPYLTMPPFSLVFWIIPSPSSKCPVTEI